jgi:Phosphorylase superfamily
MANPYTVNVRNPTSAPETITIVGALGLEANAIRRERPNAAVVEGGIALAKLREALHGTVVICGLAGGLREDLPTGALLVPSRVRRPDGREFECDAELVAAFAASARRLGVEPVFDPLLTSDTIVNGSARLEWAARGYAGVDMETGLVEARRVAAVRVVLDTPQHELSTDWVNPIRAMLKPSNWSQAIWLAREAPRAARLAARVVAQGIVARPRITRQW